MGEAGKVPPGTYMFIDWGYFLREYENLISSFFTDSIGDVDVKKLFALVNKSPDKIFIFDATKDDKSSEENHYYRKINGVDYKNQK